MLKHICRQFLSAFFLASALSLSLQAFAGNKDSNYRKLELSIPMKDGTPLSTDVYLPETNSPVPVILVRTPYNKDGAKGAAEKFLKHNIAVVSQDCRGRFKSGGEFYPFVHEREDGLTTLRWIREQKWANGKIGGWGGSYVGYTQWAVSDSLDVLTPHLTGASIYDLLYPDSLFSLQTAFNWGLVISAKKVDEALQKGIPKSYSILPLASADDSVSYDVSYINDWIEHEKYDNYWKTMDHRISTRVPVLSVAGWYDIFLKQQILDFQALSKNGNRNNRLVIGPWCHGSQGIKKDYGGVEKRGNQEDIIGNYLINHLADPLHQIVNKPFKDKKYNLFIMERNEYFGSDTWPPKESEKRSYYLGKDNDLSTKGSPESGKLHYTYAPQDPYPSLGGTGLGTNVGPALQNSNLNRKDQLIFTTPVLIDPLTLLGDLSAVLYVSSDVECTAFFVGVQDVFPNGDIVNIQEGGAGVNFPDHKVKKLEISVWSTGYEIKQGHQLRVVISSGWFPRFNRSLNSCEPAFTATKYRQAKQTVHFGTGNPSQLILPVLNDHKEN
jgi:putative CocE/NonD family hydrolase